MGLFWQIIGLALLYSACTDIVVKVSGKNQTPSQQANSAATADSDEPRLQDFEYYLYHLDDLRNVSGRDLYRRLKDNYRNVFRREFRNFRQMIIETAQRNHSYREGLTGSLTADDCEPLEHVDLQTFDGHKFLENMLEVSLLANLNIDEAAKLNPGLVEDLDVLVHLILFEMGMRAKGESQVSLEDGTTTMESSILWKVDPEIPDPPEVTEYDDYGVRFRFQRTLHLGQPKGFALTAEFAPGLFEQPDLPPEYRMVLEHDWQDRDHLGQALYITFKIWHEQDLTYSRRLAIEQTARFAQIFIFRDIIRFGLPNEEERKAVIDFAELKKCATENVQLIVPGVIGMKPDDANQLLTTMQFKIGDVDDRSAGAPESVIIRQDPAPGTKAPPETPIDLVQGVWADLEDEMAPETPIEDDQPEPEQPTEEAPADGDSVENLPTMP
jgi:hypothetical protein